MARENIRSLRKLRKLSQTALAKAAGLTASEMSRIECGYRDLSAKDARAIAKALGVTVHDIENTSPRQVDSDTHRSADRPVAYIPAAPAASTLNAASDLTDPANFRELPDPTILARGDLDPAIFCARVRVELERATRILHTSKIPAAVWRAWRDFERQGQDVLRAVSGGVTTAKPSLPGSGIQPSAPQRTGENLLTEAEQALRARRSSKARHREKSFNALLFEAARRALPSDLTTQLSAAAENRTRAEPAVGFMKHFRDVARDTLPSADLERIVAATLANEQSRGRGCNAGSPAVSSFNLQSGSRTSGAGQMPPIQSAAN